MCDGALIGCGPFIWEPISACRISALPPIISRDVVVFVVLDQWSLSPLGLDGGDVVHATLSGICVAMI